MRTSKKYLRTITDKSKLLQYGCVLTGELTAIDMWILALTG